uniref:Uncharacterized protein n=1 Tax=Plectus sambesii TaxID=2011161 RepID=A0A914UMS8_9BILA
MSDDARDGRGEIAAGGDRNRADWPTGLGRGGRRQAGRGDRPRYCVLVFLSGAFHSSSRRRPTRKDSRAPSPRKLGLYLSDDRSIPGGGTDRPSACLVFDPFRRGDQTSPTTVICGRVCRRLSSVNQRQQVPTPRR